MVHGNKTKDRSKYDDSQNIPVSTGFVDYLQKLDIVIKSGGEWSGSVAHQLGDRPTLWSCITMYLTKSWMFLYKMS